ncbi:MAG: sigma 54-interacting transcriptional regulator [Desulfuromonadales bacterium]
MGPIQTIHDRCRKCYACVRNCPVKAIKVEADWAEVIHPRCIGCGICVKVCSQQAKVIIGCIDKTRQLLESEVPVVAVLGCSFPAFFSDIRPGQLISGIRQLGFSEVHEGSAGVEMIRQQYADLIGSENDIPLISSHCPSIVDLIERHYPQLLRNLIGVVSPMVAIGQFIKKFYPDKVKVVYISSCIAGKFEIESEEVDGAIDLVLTYEELGTMLSQNRIDLQRLPEKPLGSHPPSKGRLFAISGGPFQAFGIRNEFLEAKFISTEGEENTLEIIKDLAASRISPQIVDLRFCKGGCIGGPGKNNRLTTFSKRNIILDFFRNSPVISRPADHYPGGTTNGFNLTRRFKNKFHRLATPNGDSIRRILQSTNKFVEQDELDCGSCGYNTCREHAVAVCRDLAKPEMCLPYSFKRLEEDNHNLTQKYDLARRALAQEFGDTIIIGNDPRTLETVKLIRQVGPTPTTVLIRGESGTGKELVARAIHEQSQRADKTLVTVNCTTLTDSLLESELFGHRKGSFTGAIADKKGLFEAANGGTIFLDEIGDITPKLQAELLRVLDTGEIRAVGGNTTRKVDVRLIAATNKNLEEGIHEGWFREDLYYRLNVFTITNSPLRSRLDSIPGLAHHFIEKASKRLNKTIRGIEDLALSAMMQYRWPGNIRELQNIIERAAVLTQDSVIRLENLPVIFAELAVQDDDPEVRKQGSSFRTQRDKHLGQVEKGLLKHYLQEAGGNVSQAARAANIPRRTFYRMLSRNGLRGDDFRPSAESHVPFGAHFTE